MPNSPGRKPTNEFRMTAQTLMKGVELVLVASAQEADPEVQAYVPAFPPGQLAVQTLGGQADDFLAGWRMPAEPFGQPTGQSGLLVFFSHTVFVAPCRANLSPFRVNIRRWHPRED